MQSNQSNLLILLMEDQKSKNFKNLSMRHFEGKIAGNFPKKK